MSEHIIVEDQGHTYQLMNMEGGSQILQFIKKVATQTDGYPLNTQINGTTTEAVLEALIDRMQYLNGMLPCRENSIVITHLETALMWVEKRAKDREERGVRGTLNK